MLRSAWYAGVLAIQHRDRVTAIRAAAFLDSVRSTNSATTAPLLNGLLAELALAADSGTAAESLLVETVAGASPRPPARYLWLLARRYADSGQPGLALRLAQSITRPTSRLFDRDLVLDHALYYAPALRLEAQMLEQLGQRNPAVLRYRAFVQLRADADVELQGEVGEAHAHLARLLFEDRDYGAAWHHVHAAQLRRVELPEALITSLRSALPEPRR